MTPVDAFLRSVRTAFKPDDDLPGWAWACLALGLLLAAGLLRWGLRRARRRRDEDELTRGLIERGLSPADVGTLVELAKAAALSPLAVVTGLGAFEAATARALAGLPLPPLLTGAVGEGASPAPGGDDANLFARVHRLRRALGFHVVSEHVPLLTTRELAPGTPVNVNDVPAVVTDVNEGWFAVAAVDPARAALAPEAPATVTLTRGQDGRYVARCAPASGGPIGVSRKYVFLHDEKPVRYQMRASVRVIAQGPVVLSRTGSGGATAPVAGGTLKGASEGPLKGASEGPLKGASEGTLEGTLIDISVGGCALEIPIPLAVGQALHASITWAGEVYGDLSASVRHCEGRATGYLVRLAFHGLSADHDNRLSAAIARHSSRPPTSATSAPPVRS